MATGLRAVRKPSYGQRMVPVITAIVAAAAAFAAALYRERRLELQRFLVAARVFRQSLETQSIAMASIAKPDAHYSWQTVETLTSVADITNVWQAHRDVLAGGLPQGQWDDVSRAVRTFYLAVLGPEQRTGPPADSREHFASAHEELYDASSILKPYCAHAGVFRNPGLKASNPPPAG